MTTNMSRISLKESLAQTPTKIKIYPVKFPEHQKHNSISISPNNNSSKKIYTKGDKRNKSKSTLFKFNPAYLEQMASYGTNNKTKEKEKESKERDSIEKIAREIHEKRLALFEYITRPKTLKKNHPKAKNFPKV